MDPLRIVVRVVFAFVFVLALTRISGNRTIKQTEVSSFVVALVVGDMFDDLFWAEVGAMQFAVGVATLFLVHLMASVKLFHSGARNWRRAAA